jgi:formylglycine-generating enzyme required for sulfatase activity
MLTIVFLAVLAALGMTFYLNRSGQIPKSAAKGNLVANSQNSKPVVAVKPAPPTVKPAPSPRVSIDPGKSRSKQVAKSDSVSEIIGNLKSLSKTSSSRADKSITNSIGMRLTLIPAGSFEMGSDKTVDKDASDAQMPRHTVKITKPFFLGIYEVTQEEYQNVMGTNPSSRSALSSSKDLVSKLERRKHPVQKVSWLDAIAFCNALSVKERLKPFYKIDGSTVTVPDWSGNGYRLPTEAEWEYACRAGKTTRYSFGDNEASLESFAWFVSNSKEHSHPVGEKLVNPFGLYDMHGNVWEWCWDWFGSYSGQTQSDPHGPEKGTSKVIRGGSWQNSSKQCLPAFRSGSTLKESDAFLGFRVARLPSS